jgi:polar amino acid transport system substrate-binding protein
VVRDFNAEMDRYMKQLLQGNGGTNGNSRSLVRRSVLQTALALVAIGCFTGGAWAQTSVPSTIDVIAKSKTLRVGWAVYFPYMYIDPKTQQPSGITVDLFQEIAKELGAKVVFVEDTWATMIAGLQANKFDLMMPIVNTPQRAEVVGFTTPITKISVGLAVLRNDAAKFASWEDLDKPGKRITTTLGSSIQTVVTPKFRNAELVLVKSGSESIAQVLSGRADAWANTYDAFKHMQKEQPTLTIVPGPAVGFDMVALSHRKGDLRTKQWLEEFIVKQRANGNLLRIIEKYGLDESYLAR